MGVAARGLTVTCEDAGAGCAPRDCGDGGALHRNRGDNEVSSVVHTAGVAGRLMDSAALQG